MSGFLAACLALKWHLIVLIVIPGVLCFWGERMLDWAVSTVERMRR